MFTIYRAIDGELMAIELKTFDTYEEALTYCRKTQTEPIYNEPDPEGVYLTIFDEIHDSPRYTSW